ncbi:MAG: hypothetical protein GX935_06530 [Erysipelotrichia bacterium]|nr:hypothetical protein [Erysipelotrichia bacterium]
MSNYEKAMSSETQKMVDRFNYVNQVRFYGLNGNCDYVRDTNIPYEIFISIPYIYCTDGHFLGDRETAENLVEQGLLRRRLTHGVFNNHPYTMTNYEMIQM